MEWVELEELIKCLIENNYSNIEIKHINNRSNSETCSNLLKYDLIHGKFNAKIKFDNNNIIINKNKISYGARDRFKKY